jgi:hypothetical protein
MTSTRETCRDLGILVVGAYFYFLVVWVIPKSLGGTVCVPNGIGGMSCF